MFVSRITKRNTGPNEPKLSRKWIQEPIYLGLDPRLLWETFVSSNLIQMPKIRIIQTSPKRSKKKMSVVPRFRVQIQLMVQWQEVGVFGDRRQRHHWTKWRHRWQRSEGGVTGAPTRTRRLSNWISRFLLATQRACGGHLYICCKPLKHLVKYILYSKYVNVLTHQDPEDHSICASRSGSNIN